MNVCYPLPSKTGQLNGQIECAQLEALPLCILSLMPFLSASRVSLAVEIQGWDFYFVYRGRHDFSGIWLGLRSSLFQQIVGTGIKEEG